MDSNLKSHQSSTNGPIDKEAKNATINLLYRRYVKFVLFYLVIAIVVIGVSTGFNNAAVSDLKFGVFVILWILALLLITLGAVKYFKLV